MDLRYCFLCLFLMAIIVSPTEEFLGLMNLSIEMICYYLVALLNFYFYPVSFDDFFLEDYYS